MCLYMPSQYVEKRNGKEEEKEEEKTHKRFNHLSHTSLRSWNKPKIGTSITALNRNAARLSSSLWPFVWFWNHVLESSQVTWFGLSHVRLLQRLFYFRPLKKHARYKTFRTHTEREIERYARVNKIDYHERTIHNYHQIYKRSKVCSNNRIKITTTTTKNEL